jgi:hypothetical protein
VSDFTDDPPRRDFPDEDRPRRRPRPDDWPEPPRKKSGNATLWIVLGVVGVVLLCGGITAVGLIVPAVQKVREAAARVQSTNNLRQIAIAAQSAHDANKRFPPAYGDYQGTEGSAFYHLLPYMEQGDVYKSNSLQTPIKTLQAPADPTNGPDKALTSYAANESVLIPIGMHTDILDRGKGRSYNVLFVERYAARNGPWSGKECRIVGAEGSIDRSMQPPGQPGDVAHAFTSGGCQVALADGSVKVLDKNVSDATFRWACDFKGVPNPPADW